ncbi:MAG: hypothetical protein ABEI97_04395, partial [Candidatus Nanohaloarchaea archaeon]
MKKVERVYREVLFQALENDTRELTQSAVSERCGTAIGNVSYALEPLVDMNAVEKKRRKFRVLNPRKILLYWASVRDLDGDTVYATHVDQDVREIERTMPPVLFTTYTAYKQRYGEPPAGYSEVHAYGDPETVEQRFPPQSGRENLYILETDEHLE